MQAMRLLNSDTLDSARLRTKFGRGLAGAVDMAKVLKTRADDIELHQMLYPGVKEIIEARKDGGGYAFQSRSGLPASASASASGAGEEKSITIE